MFSRPFFFNIYQDYLRWAGWLAAGAVASALPVVFDFLLPSFFVASFVRC